MGISSPGDRTSQLSNSYKVVACTRNSEKHGEPVVTIPKTRKEFNDADRKAIDKNFRAKTILICGISPDEYNRISVCQSAKEISEALQTAHEGITQVKQSKINMLTTEYELFRMKDDDSIQDMHTRFTSIINELYSLGEIIPRNKLVRKILSVLPSSWESKVNAITEAKDLQKLTIDELVGNLKTYEIKKNKDNERRESKREKNLVFKTDNNDSGGEDADMAYLTKRFQKLVRRNGGIPKRGSSSKPNNYDLCHKCGNPGYFIKDCPLLKQDQYKQNTDKAEQSRDDLIVVVVDLKETVGCIKKEKEALTEKADSIEHERYDLLVVVVYLKDTIEELNGEGRHEILKKGKEVANETHLRLEDEIKSVKSSLCIELEKNKQLQEELSRVKSDLEKSLKWTWSSEAITSMYMNNGENKQGIGFQREKFPTTLIASTLLYLTTGSALTVVTLDTLRKPVRTSFSLNRKIKFLLKRLKYSLLSVSQICDKGNKVEFVSKICTVTNLVTGEVVLVAKRYKNIYVTDFESL
nr:uncharacterized protein LOC104110921 [Nicotiana tomentosiformis]